MSEGDSKVSAAAKSKGMKRICTDCGTRFYDFGKRPIVCPSCEVEFTGEVKVKSRRGKAAADTANDDKNKKAAPETEAETAKTESSVAKRRSKPARGCTLGISIFLAEIRGNRCSFSIIRSSPGPGVATLRQSFTANGA